MNTIYNIHERLGNTEVSVNEWKTYPQLWKLMFMWCELNERKHSKCWKPTFLFCKLKSLQLRCWISSREELMFVSGSPKVFTLKTGSFLWSECSCGFLTAQHETGIYCRAKREMLELRTTTASSIYGTGFFFRWLWENTKEESHFLSYVGHWGQSQTRINVTTVLSSSESFTDIFIVIMKVFVPDEPSLGSVDEVHAVGSVVFPANFIGVMP